MSHNSHDSAPVPDAIRQQQFLNVISRDEAAERFHRHLSLAPLGAETVALADSLGRVLAEDVVSPVDVPPFDRSNVDGFALRAADTFGASEEDRRTAAINGESLSPGVVPRVPVEPGTATPIATGGMLPRGADAVAMIEHTDVREPLSSGSAGGAGDRSEPLRPPPSAPRSEGGERRAKIEISRAVAAGANVTFAGTDIARGETVLRRGQPITSREAGVIAAMGLQAVSVYRRPRVAILSTGDEIVAPGEPLRAGCIYDSNQAILSAAIDELGGAPVPMGIVPDDEGQLETAIARALSCDVVLLSGGTSKGAGDLSYRVVGRLGPPGIVAHGVALKPGKPICLAVAGGRPVVILPGFPTSAIFTFHEFVAPVIRAFAGRAAEPPESLPATLPMRVNSERGRTEYLLVGLVDGPEGLAAYPMGKGSGSVTTFSLADGFLTIPQHTEQLEAGEQIEVQLLGRSLRPADLVVIGSHCVGLDLLLAEFTRRGFTVKTMFVGSTGGLTAAKRGECDVAGIHLMDPATGEYNRPFLSPGLELVEGYRRLQTFVHRRGDARFEGKRLDDAIAAALSDPRCAMVNRNAGSGTRIVIDRLLGGARPPGYGVQAKSHNAVAAAVAQGRADWGIAIDTVARLYDLAAIDVLEEHYDFAMPASRAGRPAVRAFREILTDTGVRERLAAIGFRAGR